VAGRKEDDMSNASIIISSCLIGLLVGGAILYASKNVEPPGRYQMIKISDGMRTFWVMDTKTGKVDSCQDTENGIFCANHVDVLDETLRRLKSK
jgi:hypothetical protein